jgi:hypothetical protein
MNNKFSNIQVRNHVQKKKKRQMIQIHTFKEEGKERSKGTPLVGNGRFQASWPLEYSMFGGPLK